MEIEGDFDEDINYDDIPELDLQKAIRIPNPIFEKVTSPIRIRASVLDRVNQVSRMSGIPADILVSNIISDALDNGWTENLGHKNHE